MFGSSNKKFKKKVFLYSGQLNCSNLHLSSPDGSFSYEYLYTLEKTRVKTTGFRLRPSLTHCAFLLILPLINGADRCHGRRWGLFTLLQASPTTIIHHRNRCSANPRQDLEVFGLGGGMRRNDPTHRTWWWGAKKANSLERNLQNTKVDCSN